MSATGLRVKTGPYAGGFPPREPYPLVKKSNMFPSMLLGAW